VLISDPNRKTLLERYFSKPLNDSEVDLLFESVLLSVQWVSAKPLTLSLIAKDVVMS